MTYGPETSDNPLSYGSHQLRNTVPIGEWATMPRMYLFLGVAALIAYSMLDVLAAFTFRGYNMLNQKFSEYYAIEAASRPFAMLGTILFSMFIVGFAFGVWDFYDTKKNAIKTAIMLVLTSLWGFGIDFIFQMNVRGTDPVVNTTTGDSIHIILVAFYLLFAVVTMYYGSTLLGTQFKYYSYVSMALVVIFGILTEVMTPALTTGASTPLIGLYDRIKNYAIIIWICVLGLGLYKDYRQTKLTYD